MHFSLPSKSWRALFCFLLRPRLTISRPLLLNAFDSRVTSARRLRATNRASENAARDETSESAIFDHFFLCLSLFAKFVYAYSKIASKFVSRIAC